jgi:carbonic anhydrase
MLTAVLASVSFARRANAPRSPKTPAAARMTPKAALDSLIVGNGRFATGKTWARNYPDERRRAETAHPFAAILGCMDTRTPTDVMFDRTLGETFGIRIAGNIADSNILGSLEYAAKVKGVVLIAVIGHSDCGAVKGAISGVDMGNLTGLLRNIIPAINAVPPHIRPRDTSNPVFVQTVADSNVTWTMKQIRARSPILRELIDAGRVMLVGGMYDVKSGEVRFFQTVETAQGAQSGAKKQ